MHGAPKEGLPSFREARRPSLSAQLGCRESTHPVPASPLRPISRLPDEAPASWEGFSANQTRPGDPPVHVQTDVAPPQHVDLHQTNEGPDAHPVDGSGHRPCA